MAESKQKVRWTIITLCALLIVAGVLVIIVGSQVSRTIERRLNAEAAERGIGIDFEQARVSFTGNALLRGLCVSFLDDEQDDVCVDEVRVSADRSGLLSREVRVRAVNVTQIRLETSDERIRQLRERLQSEDSDNEDEQSSDDAEASPIASMRRVVLDSIDVRLTVDDQPLAFQVNDARAERDDDTDWQTSATLRVSELPGLVPASVAQALQDDSIALNAEFDASLQPTLARVEFGSRLQFIGPNTARVELAALTFEAPWRFVVEEPALAVPGVSAHANAASVELISWPQSIETLRFANATISGLEGTTEWSTLRAILTEENDEVQAAVPNEANEANDEGSAESAAGDANSSDADNPTQDEDPTEGIAARYLEGRRWWEALPAAIHLENSNLSLADGDASFTLNEISARYALRVIQRQMDLRFEAQLRRGDAEESASIAAEGEWAYDARTLDATFRLESMPLNWLTTLFPDLPVETLDGEATQRVSMRSEDEGLVLEHELELANVVAELGLLSAPLEIPSLQTESTFRVSPAELAEGEARAYSIETMENTTQVADAQLSLKPAVVALRRTESGLRFDRADLSLSIPDQPVMTLWRAIPRSLLGESADAEMEGEWGLDWRFSISAEESETGLRYEVHASDELEIRDTTLALRSLPRSVDVTRLNEPMRFTFRGPDDRIMRELQLAPPRWIGGPYPHVPQGVDTTPEGWTRLDAMSFYLIAAQLYREDGSFFTNSGVNWFQLRRVIGEALSSGRLGRGASTISMQLVKNIFLSHERTIERKVQELFLTYWMTRTVPKERILEVYLNIIEWGPGVNGAAEASRFYFNRSITELDVLDAIWLSHITPNPLVFGRGRARRSLEPGDCTNCDRIALRLHERGWIDDFELRRAQGQSPFDLQPMALPSIGESGPPLLDALDAPETDVDLSRMGPRSRLMHWVESSRRLRGPDPSRR